MIIHPIGRGNKKAAIPRLTWKGNIPSAARRPLRWTDRLTHDHSIRRTCRRGGSSWYNARPRRWWWITLMSNWSSVPCWSQSPVSQKGRRSKTGYHPMFTNPIGGNAMGTTTRLYRSSEYFGALGSYAGCLCTLWSVLGN